MEPVKGFLGRYLRRKLIEAEIQTRARNNDLAKIADWMPKVWQHLNKFLEMHSSSDVTIGPRLFLSCPMDVPGSQVWFTDLWNYSIVPYLLEAVREGLQVNVSTCILSHLLYTHLRLQVNVTTCLTFTFLVHTLVASS